MKLPPQLELDGLQAYEQVRAFEGVRRQRLPWIYGGSTLLLLIYGALALDLHHSGLAVVSFVIAALCLGWAGWSARRLRLRYEKNLRFLAELQSQYGESLPWLEVERHLAALEQLQWELKQDSLPDP